MTARETPESLYNIAATGTRSDTLHALRDVLAAAIDADPPARDLAALSRRLLEVLAEIEGVIDYDEEFEKMLSTPQRDDPEPT